MTARIVVIGGGITGLTAALDLADAGAEVCVLEAEQLGGKLRTTPFAGRSLDEGPDALLARVPEGTELAERVGLGDQLVSPATGQAFVCLDDHLVALPSAHVLGVPTDPEAPDLAAVLSPAARRRLRQDCSAPGAPLEPGQDETIGGFIRRRLGDEVADRLVGPLVGGINAGNIDDLGLDATAPQIAQLARQVDEPSLVRAAARARSRIEPGRPVFVAPRGGMASLAAAAVQAARAQGVELHEHVAVRALEPIGPSWRVIADDARRTGAATSVTFEADGLLLATPAGTAAMILQDFSPTASIHLGGIRHASVALAAFAYPADALAGPLDGSGFLVPRTQGLLTTAASWSSTKWAHLAPEFGDGTVLMRLSAGRSDDRRIASMDDQSIVTTMHDELTRILGITGAPSATRVTRWPSSLPQYDLDHASRIDAIEADLPSTVTVAGCALRGVGIPASIRSGHRAAATLLAALGVGRTP